MPPPSEHDSEILWPLSDRTVRVAGSLRIFWTTGLPTFTRNVAPLSPLAVAGKV